MAYVIHRYEVTQTHTNTNIAIWEQEEGQKVADTQGVHMPPEPVNNIDQLLHGLSVPYLKDQGKILPFHLVYSRKQSQC